MNKSARSITLALVALFATASLSAQLFVGSDNFNSGSPDALWSYAFRTIGSPNGTLSFANSELDFTKGASSGSYFRGWAGGGDPASYTTSWTADLTVTNMSATGAGEYSSVGFEIAGANGQYSALMLQSTNGSSVFRAESSGVTAVTTPATGNANIQLRLTWNAVSQVLSTSYSYDGGSTYSLLTNLSPVSSWVSGSPASGFYFEVFANSTVATAITTGSMSADNFALTAVPEPSTYAALFGLSALGFVAYCRRKNAVV